VLLGEYEEYLVRERGLTGSTVRAYIDFARRFIAEERPRLDWRRMTAADVARFVMRTARRFRPPMCKLMVTALRSLLRFLHVRGSIALDLASGVPTVAGWRLSGLPKAIEACQVVRILAAFGGSPAGLRGAAIVRLLVRLGLRAGEVAALDLDDVDWRTGELVVRGKGRHDSRLPLPPDVGRALAAYLRRGRPRSSVRALFLRDRAPFTRLRPGAVCHVARTALAVVGVRGGAHRFRHTAATLLLRRGASLSEIAHVLRHRSADTTAIYAKVDLAALGTVARRWPGGAP
jgi:site-specific recombinase XerC